MPHPYTEFEDTPVWRAIERAIGELEESSDLVLTTGREYVVGFISKAVSELALGSLSEEEGLGLVRALGEACQRGRES